MNSEITYDLSPTECPLYKKKLFNSTEDFRHYQISEQHDILVSMALGLPAFKVALTVIGFLTNLLNIVVLTRTSPITSINLQCAALEIVNLLLFVTYFYEIPMFYDLNYVVWWSEKVGVAETISLCLSNTCICASNWLTVTVAVWRFVAVSYPLKASVYCDKFKSKMIVLGIVSFSVLLWVYYYTSFDCHLFVYKIGDEDPLTYRVIGNWRTAENGYYFRLYYPLAVVFSTTVPWTSLCILSILLGCSLRNAASDRMALIRVGSLTPNEPANSADKRVTVYLTAMILTYVLAYLPDGVISIMYLFYHQSFIQTLLICKLSWSRYGILLCNSFTICFYCGMSERLRRSYVTIALLPFKKCSAAVTLCNGRFSEICGKKLEVPVTISLRNSSLTSSQVTMEISI